MIQIRTNLDHYIYKKEETSYKQGFLNKVL